MTNTMNYIDFIRQPASSNRLGEYLKAQLSRPEWTHFRAAVAFITRSGTRHLETALSSFAQTRAVEIIAGIDHCGTSADGLQALLDAVSPTGRVIIFHNNGLNTFHPKVFLFKSATAADISIGSGNLTEGGLFTNYEAALRLSLNLAKPGHATILRSIEQALDTWADLSTGPARILDASLLATLRERGCTPSEASMREAKARTRSKRGDSLFAARPVHRAPPLPRRAIVPRPPAASAAT